MNDLEKEVRFYPMTIGQFFAKRNWSMPSDMDPKTEGYMIENEKGYTTWLSVEEFEDTYGDCLRMTFGEALQHLKEGCKVARTGWNGKGMWLGYVEADNYVINFPPHRGEDTLEGECKKLLPWIGMRTSDKAFVPWLASQSDILAEDWCIVE